MSKNDKMVKNYFVDNQYDEKYFQKKVIFFQKTGNKIGLFCVYRVEDVNKNNI